jgi:hypothetical protein
MNRRNFLMTSAAALAPRRGRARARTPAMQIDGAVPFYAPLYVAAARDMFARRGQSALRLC